MEEIGVRAEEAFIQPLETTGGGMTTNLSLKTKLN